ncbi:uncharacterized protein C19orf44 homolog isoform X2 [Scophthalmus maximus]|uniref:uncharacterized protein C19orf44 homolog isoform X2 n=1 Tax=Scophthalmus maximus TaxID=52904 RepID=UPI0015E145FC|nr:uncharacterized protein C19orf44 homolog isoform X2 [Scophthalmus maximus]
MWNRGGRSSALDRAQALLSARRSARGDAAESTQRPTDTARTHAGAVGGSMKTRSGPQKGHPVFSDLSDLSSVSPAPENGDDTVLSVKSLGREGGSTEGLRPQRAMGGGGGSRFLKKAPPPATISSHSPVSRCQKQQMHEPRYVSSSQYGSKTAAMSRLNNREAAAAAAGSPAGPDVGVRSMSRAAGAALSLAGSETRSTRVVSAVSLESDEEDMRKLLGDSLDSTDGSVVKVGRPSSVAHKMLGKGNQRVHFTPPPVSPSPPSNTAPPRSPASPSCRSSPFRFTGQIQAQFSPSVLSPAPSSPRVSPSPQRRLNSAGGAGSPQRSLSSLSGHSEVISLEELFPAGPGSAHLHSEMSSVSSEDFKINVMSLDDLIPAAFGFTEETSTKEREAKHIVSDQQPPRLREEEEGDVLDYQSDFESESRSETNPSASQVSEHLQGDGDEAEVVSEDGEEASNSDVSRGRTEDDYSSSDSDTTSRISARSRTSKSVSTSSTSGTSGSRSSVSHQGRRVSARKVLKEAAVQTQPDTMMHTWSAGTAMFDPMTYVNPTPVAAYTLSAETVEALSTSNPAAFVLNEMLKQQLAMTRRFIESSRQLHSSLVRSLEPPNYRYTTLEDTRENIRKHRSHKLTMEEALEEVQREMRESV